ncbi:hypothetical protein [Sulfitobacter sp.]|uniref:hypothetical protein n=1 Tax=Sulfitobacter sp. TaxID=1903071 RepID=UPI0032992904
MTPETWARLPPHVRDNFLATETATRRACKAADAADAAAEKAAEEKVFRDKVDAASAADGGCRSAVKTSAAKVDRLRRQLDAAEREHASTIYAREKSRKVKATLDREALERFRSKKPTPPLALPSPGIPACPFLYTPTAFDFAFVHLPVSTIARHTKTAFRPEHAKVV